MQLLEPEETAPAPAVASPSPQRPFSAVAVASLPPVLTGVLPIGHRCFLPDSTPLVLTMSRKILFANLWNETLTDEQGNAIGTREWSFPRTTQEHLVVFWACSHPPAAWYVTDQQGMPLYLRFVDLMRVVDEWADTSCLATMDEMVLVELVTEFWTGQHANKAEPLDDDKKKATPMNPEPPASTGSTRPSESSPAETPPEPKL